MKVQFYSVFSYRISDGRWVFLGTCHPHIEGFDEIDAYPTEEIKLPKTMMLGRKIEAKSLPLPGDGRIYYVPTMW